jgi:hypothetical protein
LADLVKGNCGLSALLDMSPGRAASCKGNPELAAQP